jgi:K+-transporting ATPase, c chain
MTAAIVPVSYAPGGAPSGHRRRRTWARHLRATAVLVVGFALVLGIAYPLFIVGIGEIFTPSTANGSLTYNPNGTVNGSSVLPPGTNSTLGGPVQPLPTPARAPVGTVLVARPVGPFANVPFAHPDRRTGGPSTPSTAGAIGPPPVSGCAGV